jgi:hypothetical protein
MVFLHTPPARCFAPAGAASCFYPTQKPQQTPCQHLAFKKDELLRELISTCAFSLFLMKLEQTWPRTQNRGIDVSIIPRAIVSHSPVRHCHGATLQPFAVTQTIVAGRSPK